MALPQWRRINLNKFGAFRSILGRQRTQPFAAERNSRRHSNCAASLQYFGERGPDRSHGLVPAKPCRTGSNSSSPVNTRRSPRSFSAQTLLTRWRHTRRRATRLATGPSLWQRHLIPSRTDEGRVRAKARGVRFGRRPKLTAHQQAEALARVAQGETLTAIARGAINVSAYLTISRLAGVAFMQ